MRFIAYIVLSGNLIKIHTLTKSDYKSEGDYGYHSKATTCLCPVHRVHGYRYSAYALSLMMTCDMAYKFNNK